MYDELVKRLRNEADFPYNDNRNLMQQAADAIEELITKLNHADEQIEKLVEAAEERCWIPFESRPMDDEECQYYSEHFGYDLTDDDAIFYCCQLPEDGEEVLVCDKWDHVWIDTFDNDPDYGIGFETNGDMDGIVAWMPKPKPYKPPKEE